MTDKIDRLDRMVVRAMSPDGRIIGVLRSNGDVDVGFRDPDRYYDYTAPELAQQLTTLLRSMKTARDSAVAAEFGTGKPNMSRLDAQRRRYHEQLEELASYGISRNGVVDISAIGSLRQQQVGIDAEAFAYTNVSGFLVELHSAYEDLLRDLRTQRRDLKRQNYGK